MAILTKLRMLLHRLPPKLVTPNNTTGTLHRAMCGRRTLRVPCRLDCQFMHRLRLLSISPLANRSCPRLLTFSRFRVNKPLSRHRRQHRRRSFHRQSGHRQPLNISTPGINIWKWLTKPSTRLKWLGFERVMTFSNSMEIARNNNRQTFLPDTANKSVHPQNRSLRQQFRKRHRPSPCRNNT